MTCIVALETPDGVWMGGDRMASSSWESIDLDMPKIFRNGSALIGNCGSVRHHQLWQYSVNIPEDRLTWDVDRWVAHDLTWSVRHAFEQHGAKAVKDGVDRGGNVLFAIRGRVYEIQSDYSFTRARSGEYAVGSGWMVAFGALHATRDWPDPRARVLAALTAAADCTPFVSGPFDIEFQEATA